MSTEHLFQLPDLSCGHCVATVTRALAALGASVQADPVSKQVRVTAPDGVERAQLEAALKAAGYSPETLA